MESKLATVSNRKDPMDKGQKPWFAQGLKFQCTGCGKCCTGAPGYVFLSSVDLEHLANHLSLDVATFKKKYTVQVDDRIALIDLPGSYDCIFLTNRRCSIYEARPIQCRTFPWWISNLRDPADWEEASKRCEGINHPEAPVVPSLEIEVKCLTYLDNILEEPDDS